MRRTGWILGLAILLVGSLNLFRARSAPAQSFEYKFEYYCSEKSANSMAGQGWELVSHTLSYTVAGASPLESCVFKRPKA
jgi:hypothetical protein